jgi:hypothetical protein
MQAIGKGTEVDRSGGVAKIERASAVGRERGLLKREQEMAKAAFASTVRPKNHGQWRQLYQASIAPRFEILNAELGKHEAPLAEFTVDHSDGSPRAELADVTEDGQVNS